MTITFMELPTQEEEESLIEDVRKNMEKNMSIAAKSSLGPSIMRLSLTESSRMVERKITGQLTLPDSSFVINQRDDSAEFDDDVQSDKVDPK